MNDDSNKLYNFKTNDILDRRTNNKINFNNGNNINKSIRIRNPGIDLIRIVATFCIVITHVLFHGKAIKKYHKYKELQFLNIIVFWHINAYCLISGFVGYKNYKYSNLIYLWFYVMFYSVGIALFYKLIKGYNVELYPEFFPVIFNKYWYFTSYFGMYLFLPIINKGIEYLTKSEYKLLVISIYVVFIIWRDYNNIKIDVFRTDNGTSILWFLILYITGGYLGKNKAYFEEINKFVLCIICIFMFLFASLLYYYLPVINLSKIKLFFIKKITIITKNLFVFKHDSFSKMIQTISISLLLINIKYNKYLAKIISFFGSLTFGVYLIHDNYLIRNNIINHD